jgi:hypothetical protein
LKPVHTEEQQDGHENKRHGNDVARIDPVVAAEIPEHRAAHDIKQRPRNREAE